ncbi:hypothetical protein H4R18_004044 [Coemansia javaensis]|uniref:BZIP domain-containing protein n=1 Tax=Coemansia javaensis TaxID=2761396 RepID=A0A9W8LHP4_9FUNG|nr:hypothetical protein H4R18_004044 [Coemansia javaensis]
MPTGGNDPDADRVTGGPHQGQGPGSAQHYVPIQPRGNPDEHRQAMAEEKELADSQIQSIRRYKNARAAARMRERQRDKERSLIQRKNELVAREQQLKAELAALRNKRAQDEAMSLGADCESLVRQLSDELEDTIAATQRVADEIQDLLRIVQSLGQ